MKIATRGVRALSLASTAVALLGTVLVAACAPDGVVRAPGGTAERAPAVHVPAGPAGPTGPTGPAAPAGAAAKPSSALPASVPATYDGAPLRTEIEPGAPDSALLVPALARPNLPPRSEWQPPEAARVPFAARIERWRWLVRHVLAEEWQAGTLDGQAQRLDDDLVLAMMQQESQGDPRALSPVGAQGLMQVMPQTFAIMMAGNAKLAPAIDPDAFWDESTNIRAGIRYMALALQNHEGNFYWSLASYNAGIGPVKRWRMAGLYAVPPVGGYTETARYAPVILRNYLAHRPGLDLYVPPAMVQDHVAGALELISAFRRR
jgi:soluble lytic murein transglycosylase-like protein